MLEWMTVEQAEATLDAMARSVFYHQGKRRRRVFEVINLIDQGRRMSGEFEARYSADPGWFDRMLTGHPSKLTRQQLSLYGLAPTYGHPSTL